MILKALGSLGILISSGWILGATGPQNTGPIKIGHVDSLTGPEASFGQGASRGIGLALKQLNEKGGVRGKKVELVTLDNQGKSDEAVTAITKLLTREKVLGVLGEQTSSRTLAMAPIAQKYKVPLVSPSATNPKVTEVGEFIFRVCFIDPYQGQAADISFTLAQPADVTVAARSATATFTATASSSGAGVSATIEASRSAAVAPVAAAPGLPAPGKATATLSIKK